VYCQGSLSQSSDKSHEQAGVKFHALWTRQAGLRKFISLHVLVSGDWTVQRGHQLLERIEDDIRQAVRDSAVFTHLDVTDKHFQKEPHLSLTQSALVQLAHYLGYFIMALSAGWLMKLDHKGGIIPGLLMVAVGTFWFSPATHIAAFWTFLLGVCVVAAGLIFLETIAGRCAKLIVVRQA
jgi:Dimerisation domain of Zinc Transporter